MRLIWHEIFLNSKMKCQNERIVNNAVPIIVRECNFKKWEALLKVHA